MEAQVADFRRRTASRKRRIEQTEITDQQKKRAKESRMQELAESSKRQEEARKLEEERRLKEIEEQQRLGHTKSNLSFWSPARMVNLEP